MNCWKRVASTRCEKFPEWARIAGAIAELARTGRWTYLEHLRGAGEVRDVFRAIPGVGPILAKRLHQTLQVETLEQLEATLRVRPLIAIAVKHL